MAPHSKLCYRRLGRDVDGTVPMCTKVCVRAMRQRAMCFLPNNNFCRQVGKRVRHI